MSDPGGTSVDRPAWPWWVAVVGGLAATAVVAFTPSLEAPLSVVPGTLDQGLLRIVFVAAVISHVAQGLHGLRLAVAVGLSGAGWGAQGFLLGFPSTRALHARAGRSTDVGLACGATFVLPLLALLLLRLLYD